MVSCPILNYLYISLVFLFLCICLIGLTFASEALQVPFSVGAVMTILSVMFLIVMTISKLENRGLGEET